MSVVGSKPSGAGLRRAAAARRQGPAARQRGAAAQQPGAAFRQRTAAAVLVQQASSRSLLGRHLAAIPRSSSSGFTLVELMVALAIGLVVIASAGVAMADLVRSAARTLMVTRVDQDLRIAVDLIAGELRRAGYWEHAERALASGVSSGVASGLASGLAAPRNPYQAISVSPAGDVSYSQSRDVENDVVDGNESFGFRLRASAIEYRLGGSGWQTLTDASVVAVTRMSITPWTSVQWLSDSCAAPCWPGAPTAASPACPSLTLRRFDITLQAHAVTDPNVVRSVALSVRSRNDALEGGC